MNLRTEPITPGQRKRMFDLDVDGQAYDYQPLVDQIARFSEARMQLPLQNCFDTIAAIFAVLGNGWHATLIPQNWHNSGLVARLADVTTAAPNSGPKSSHDGNADLGLTRIARPHDNTTTEEHDPWQWVRTGKGQLTLQTSGTAGAAKTIRHTFDSLTAGVRTGAHHRLDRWGLAFHPASFAGLQVILQAVLNLNSIASLFQLPSDQVAERIGQSKITHLSATPTFYRMLSIQGQRFDSVVSVAVGGESSSPLLFGQLAEMFPHARLSNIYASTELGGLLRSDHDEFTIPDRLQHLIRVDEGRLRVHGSLISASGIELDADGFFTTGDQVTVLQKQPLRFSFLARPQHVINVGGSKVDPQRVEAVLEALPEVGQAVVFAKPNSVMGNLVACQIVLRPGFSLSSIEIRNRLSQSLEPFEIPRLIQFVAELESTLTGKKRRLS